MAAAVEPSSADRRVWNILLDPLLPSQKTSFQRRPLVLSRTTGTDLFLEMLTVDMCYKTTLSLFSVL